jgi:hypothetical protein
MEPYEKAWRAHRAMAWLFIAVAAFIIGWDRYAAAPLAMVSSPHATAGGLTLLAICHAVVSWGSRDAKPWARTGTLFLGFVLLFLFPVGTIVGAYLIYCGVKWPIFGNDRRKATGAWHPDAVRSNARLTDRRR